MEVVPLFATFSCYRWRHQEPNMAVRAIIPIIPLEGVTAHRSDVHDSCRSLTLGSITKHIALNANKTEEMKRCLVEGKTCKEGKTELGSGLTGVVISPLFAQLSVFNQRFCIFCTFPYILRFFFLYEARRYAPARECGSCAAHCT